MYSYNANEREFSVHQFLSTCIEYLVNPHLNLQSSAPLTHGVLQIKIMMCMRENSIKIWTRPTEIWSGVRTTGKISNFGPKRWITAMGKSAISAGGTVSAFIFERPVLSNREFQQQFQFFRIPNYLLKGRSWIHRWTVRDGLLSLNTRLLWRQRVEADTAI